MAFRILVTGGDGQLATALLRLGDFKNIKGFDKSNLNILDYKQILNIFDEYRPDVVIHCAAYTHVDACEKNVETAYEINSYGTENIASACKKINAQMIYISTDYVFDGKKGRPYFETDKPNPINVYGKTKLEGEKIVSSIMKRYYIVRTSWLYGGYGKNFANTILNFAGNSSEIRIVDDQIGSPTYVIDLAQAIYQVMDSNQYGIYHASNCGCCSWYEFAQEILKCGGYNHIRLVPIASDELNQAAKRPYNSTIINSKDVFELRDWKKALHDYMKSKA